MKLSGITADTGFLIGLERKKRRSIEVLTFASSRRIRISVPVAALAEWWRGGAEQVRILRLVASEEMTEALAKSAGEAMAQVPGASVVDAIVMDSAAHGGGVVYTSDVDDLSRLATHFRAVRIFGV